MFSLRYSNSGLPGKLPDGNMQWLVALKCMCVSDAGEGR